MLTQRMYIAVLRARVEAKVERENRLLVQRLEEEQAFPDVMQEGGDQPGEEQRWTEEENEVWLRARFPGYEWTQRVGEGDRSYPPFVSSSLLVGSSYRDPSWTRWCGTGRR